MNPAPRCFPILKATCSIRTRPSTSRRSASTFPNDPDSRLHHPHLRRPFQRSRCPRLGEPNRFRLQRYPPLSSLQSRDRSHQGRQRRHQRSGYRSSGARLFGRPSRASLARHRSTRMSSSPNRCLTLGAAAKSGGHRHRHRNHARRSPARQRSPGSAGRRKRCRSHPSATAQSDRPQARQSCGT